MQICIPIWAIIQPSSRPKFLLLDRNKNTFIQLTKALLSKLFTKLENGDEYADELATAQPPFVVDMYV